MDKGYIMKRGKNVSERAVKTKVAAGRERTNMRSITTLRATPSCFICCGYEISRE